MNLFFDEEWEVINVTKIGPGIPWGTSGAEMTEEHKKVSNNYYSKCLTIQLKLDFASGLRESIKRQT